MIPSLCGKKAKTERRMSMITRCVNTLLPVSAKDYSAAFDFDINENHKLTFKGIFNNRNDWENRYRTTIKDLDENGKGTVRIQTKAGTPDNRNARLERQRTMDFALGGEHLWELSVWTGTPVMPKLRKNVRMNVISIFS